ncbi:Bifunctional arginine demethylase and lysyl-hydroxylase JMJD6 [Symbiodinium microadriaticum]|uniref:Bifunctional arginine demethylase and lysyl-hydroxylase JMJD6 n=1 Tax=Symbiodinium microadriaticum TaxID=2951 RepID=A0A1Q9CJT7_SYMMI|nr:Bifunctional arginine demethylase and lysyl-hydroxylase JMJD6 [Symbiodinium microadriaticum]
MAPTDLLAHVCYFYPCSVSTAAPSTSPQRAGSGSPSPSSDAAQRRIPQEVKFQHRRTAGEVRRCKKGKRTDIKPHEWDKFGYASKEEVLHREIVYDDQTVPIRRVKFRDITPERFIEEFGSKSQPVIVEDCCSHWPAMDKWSIDALEERFRHVSFKVAKDDNGKKLRMKFKYFADYVRHQKDDNPLYLFETDMDDNGFIRPLMDDYEVPSLFPHDWFSLVNADSRPPFRWFCIGPKRSGTTVHIDPLGTAAWNAVTHGTKRWVLFEPHEAKKRVKGKDLLKEDEDDEAIMYFDYILPRIKQAYPDLKVYEGLQKPGEVIFVPGDWWHGVLNLEDTVAVTQNYCGPDNFELVWTRTRKEREKVAWLWLRNMRKYAPDLYQKAMTMNRRDRFKMRHERPAGERLSDASSSSSESSSDSSSDEGVDLDPAGLEAAVPDAFKKLGAACFQKQGRYAVDRMSTTARNSIVPGERGNHEAALNKRRRIQETVLQG